MLIPRISTLRSTDRLLQADGRLGFGLGFGAAVFVRLAGWVLPFWRTAGLFLLGGGAARLALLAGCAGGFFDLLAGIQISLNSRSDCVSNLS